jgi:hypothetical protein
VQPDFSKIPLHDIHLPPPVSWWPPAFGWWLLLLLVIAAVAFGVYLARRYRRYKLFRAAMKELNALYKNYQNNYDAKRFARELSVLLRRICISYFPKGEAAGLAGGPWLAYLDSLLLAKHNKSGHKFSEGIGTVLVSAPYRDSINDGAINVDALYRLSSEWIRSLGPVNRAAAKPVAAQPSPPSSGDVSETKEAAHVSV